MTRETMKFGRCIFLFLVLFVVAPQEVPAQEVDYGSRLGQTRSGGEVSFEPRGPGVLFGALDPAVRRWYVPQELYEFYQWKQWDIFCYVSSGKRL